MFFQALEEEGLDKYIDARYLQQEIAEATDTTQEELDKAAHELIHSSGSSSNAKMPYYEHLGGYSMQEMKDYNQYSSRDDIINRGKRGYSEEEDTDDQMVYVTTL